MDKQQFLKKLDQAWAALAASYTYSHYTLHANLIREWRQRSGR
jgi:hypothetical protein